MVIRSTWFKTLFCEMLESYIVTFIDKATRKAANECKRF